jgi:hypothetical protein
MSDEKLIEEARAFLGDETVIVAGIFEPRGATGGLVGATEAGLLTDNVVGEAVGIAAGLGAGKAMSHADGVPRWTMLAVTPTTLHAIECGQHGVGWQPKQMFATFDRSKITATVHRRVLPQRPRRAGRTRCARDRRPARGGGLAGRARGRLPA